MRRPLDWIVVSISMMVLFANRMLAPKPVELHSPVPEFQTEILSGPAMARTVGRTARAATAKAMMAGRRIIARAYCGQDRGSTVSSERRCSSVVRFFVPVPYGDGNSSSSPGVPADRKLSTMASSSHRRGGGAPPPVGERSLASSPKVSLGRPERSWVSSEESHGVSVVGRYRQESLSARLPSVRPHAMHW